MSKVKKRYERYKVSEVWGLLDSRETNEWKEVVGHVRTPHGYVIVRAYAERGHKRTSYEFMFDGHEYWLSENVFRNERGCAIVAGRFARQVVAGEIEEVL